MLGRIVQAGEVRVGRTYDQPGSVTTIPAGYWIAASRLRGRLIHTTDDYPHVCGFGRLWRRDCAACAQDAADRAVAK